MPVSNLYAKISNYFNQTDNEREQTREEEIDELLSDMQIQTDTNDDEIFITYT